MLRPHIVEYDHCTASDTPFIVFDRDGTLTVDAGYTHKVEDFEWNPDILPILSLISERHIPVSIATNQSGVARGFFSLEQVDQFHRHLVDRAADLGVQVVVIATCPHPAAQPPACECRKPLPGLVKAVVERMGVSTANGFMVGDRLSDLEAGRLAGLNGLLVPDAHAALAVAWGGG